jgi:hypothetical protein
MQVPDDIRKSVAFMYCRRNSGLQAVGTTFFVGYPIEGIKDRIATYAITARHVIESIRKRGIDGQSYFRFNKREGGIGEAQLPVNEWRFSEDARVDVAIAPVAMDFARFDHRVLPYEMFLSDARILENGIGPGDELFFPGLFARHQGKESSIPIMRVGNIAAMPGERISTREYGDIRAYLVEARSIGGLSGSPVFIHLGPTRMRGGNYVMFGGPHYYLLGLVHGHYDLNDVLDETDNLPFPDGTPGLSVNMGIALVIPADDIDALLHHPDFVEQRRQAREHLLKEQQKNLPVTD